MKNILFQVLAVLQGNRISTLLLKIKPSPLLILWIQMFVLFMIFPLIIPFYASYSKFFNASISLFSLVKFQRNKQQPQML